MVVRIPVDSSEGTTSTYREDMATHNPPNFDLDLDIARPSNGTETNNNGGVLERFDNARSCFNTTVVSVSVTSTDRPSTDLYSDLMDAASQISVVYTLNQAYSIGTVHLIVLRRLQRLLSSTGATHRVPWPSSNMKPPAHGCNDEHLRPRALHLSHLSCLSLGTMISYPDT